MMRRPSELYAKGAFWQQHPFREPEPGYLARVFAEEEPVHCQFGAPVVDGDQAGAVDRADQAGW